MTNEQYLRRMYEENKHLGYIELRREQIRLYMSYLNDKGEPIIQGEKLKDFNPSGICATNLMLWDLPIKQISTLLECTRYIDKNVHDGVKCPVCTRFVKLYSRSYSSAMAVFLIGLYKYSIARGFMGSIAHYHYIEVLKEAKISTGGDYAKNCFWGLMEPMAEDKEELEKEGKKSSGYFKITDLGVDFVTGKIKIPAKVNILLNQSKSFSDKDISIEDALGTKFDYYELMKG